MVRCVPPDPQFTTAAEREAWLAVQRGLGPDDVLLANLRLTDAEGDHEADLVVGLEGAGVVVVEVKGGHVSHDGRQWVQSGAVTKVVDPVEQARRTKYALQRYLSRDPRWRHRRVRFAHAVAFPYTPVRADFALPDLPRALVLDADDLAVDPADRLRQALLLQVRGDALPGVGDLDDLLAVLGGRGLPQRDLLVELADREAQVELTTERQAAILHALRLLPRVEVRGGAGSGKTWLAVEQARRLSAEGKRVALTCYSRGLAAYLQRRTAGLGRRERPAYVGTFHGLGLTWGGPTGTDADSAFWEERLPAAMLGLARGLPDGQRYDAVVVDEAQDFADAWWAPLLAALRDEETGGVYVFADEGQRVFARQGRPPVSLVPVLLDENLRNTVPIAQTFGSLTPLQMRYRGGQGPPVRFVPCASEEAVDRADEEVERLVEAEGWPVDAVALLTTGRRHPVQVERQATGQDEYWAGFYDDTDVFYGHVLGFKGLERPAVVLAVNGFGVDERAREKLYVGLSRARDLLVVCGDRAQIEAVGGEAVVRRLAGTR